MCRAPANSTTQSTITDLDLNALKEQREDSVPSTDVGRNTQQLEGTMILLAEGALFVGRKLPVCNAVAGGMAPDLVLHARHAGLHEPLRSTPAEARHDHVDLLAERATDTA